VVVVVIAVASGKDHGGIFWTTIVLMTLFAGWAARRARTVWRRARSPAAASRPDA
jgi:hypothetical protein